MSKLFFDHRWCAPHGIGRFATEVRRRLNGFSDLPIGGSPTSPMDALRLARCLRRADAKGFLSPGFNVPLGSTCPVVVTIHDLIHVHYAGERTAFKSAYYRFVQRRIVRRSPVILTVSEYSREQIIQWYDVSETRVVCVGNGVSEEFTEQGESFSSKRPFFLYVGNAKPHKNVPTLLSAMANLAAEGDAMLMLVTEPDSQLREKISAFALEQNVTILTGLNDRELATLYRAAIALVLPSHYEGFGLPIVEAMACGCPVIGSNCTSIPEVLGGAGELFDPSEPEALADKMRALLGNPDLRAQLRQKGLVRATEFTWDRVASKVRESIAPHMA
jgi:glycosyltransferase involved in cell wall biosynthesis